MAQKAGAGRGSLSWPEALSQTSSTNLADTSKPKGKGPFSRGNLQSWMSDNLALDTGPPCPTQQQQAEPDWKQQTGGDFSIYIPRPPRPCFGAARGDKLV